MEKDEISLHNKVRSNIALLITRYTEGSQAEFSKKTGIATSQLNQILTGTREKVPLNAIFAIFLAFPQTDLHWLLGLKDEQGNIVVSEAETEYGISTLKDTSLKNLLEANKNQSIAILQLVELLNKK